jgi:hypothetical protein
LNDVVHRIINCFYAPIANEAEPRWLIHQRQQKASIGNRHAANYQSGGYKSLHSSRPATCAVNFLVHIPSILLRWQTCPECLDKVRERGSEGICKACERRA